MLRAIGPAVEAARSQCTAGEDLVDTSARLNVITQAEGLSASPVIREAVVDGRLTVQAAWYDLASGVVSRL